MRTIDCPSCNRVLMHPDAGQDPSLRCPGCGSTFTLLTEDAIERLELQHPEAPTSICDSPIPALPSASQCECPISPLPSARLQETLGTASECENSDRTSSLMPKFVR